eukprot:CAMPEP_0114270160 /NCGR_PEP_ID=MMETSP0058-20121206/27074_1 /TAXON_ID=36894 /ORGANISM="Pyramimonas parkeae, CCMP726" /LENGTH=850 /DNA_ID=CAMNT_0001388847 /DNA_START=251 /DNA_END=2803 /DNA_ORIENTATION=-
MQLTSPQSKNQTRSYLDLASQGFTPYHRFQSVSAGTRNSPNGEGLLGAFERPMASLSRSERSAKLQLWVTHLHSASEGAYALRATVDEIAEAAKDPTTRQELVDLLILPCNGPALLTLEALVGAEEDTLSRSGIRAICTILWPASPSNLPLASVLLTLNRLVDCRERPVHTITQMLTSLANTLAHPLDKVATDAANVLRFMMCVSHDTWSKMHQQVAGTLLLALARLLRSQRAVVFAEGCRAALWLVESNPQTVHRIGYGTQLEPLVLVHLWDAFATALRSFPPGQGGPADASPLWEFVLHVAQLPSGRMNLLGHQYTSSMHQPPALSHASSDSTSLRVKGIEAARALVAALTESLHKPARARRALSVLKALVSDTSDGAGHTCAQQVLLLSEDAGFLFLSASMALKDACGESSFLPDVQRRDHSGVYTAEKAADCARFVVLKFLGASQYEHLKRWVGHYGALSDAEERSVTALTCGMTLVLHDSAVLAVAEAPRPAQEGGAPTTPAQRQAQVAAADWLMVCVLDALHATTGASPGHKLVACLGDNSQELLAGLAHVTSAANPVVAMKGVQMVYALTQSDQGPFLTPSTLDALVLSLASRCVRLPLADPNQEQLMVLAVDALHGCFDRPSGQDLLHMLLSRRSGQGSASATWWPGWLGGQSAHPTHTETQRASTVVPEYFLTGISHAMNLEDLTAAGKALELVVRALHHPCGEGYRTYVSLGDVLPWLQRVNMFMQAWPYTQRFQNRTFGELRDAMQRNAVMVVLAFTEDACGREILDHLDQDVMVTMVKALRILENKATTTLHLDPPTRTLAAKVLHSLTYECSTKWMVAVQRQASPMTAMFSNLFASS